MHQLVMFFQISFLTKGFGTFFALERLNTTVKSDVIFDVAGLVEGLAATVYQALYT
jgi:hypothetical protein